MPWHKRRRSGPGFHDRAGAQGRQRPRRRDSRRCAPAAGSRTHAPASHPAPWLLLSLALRGGLARTPPSALDDHGPASPQAIEVMTALNAEASRLALSAGARCAADVTGFGPAGHPYKPGPAVCPRCSATPRCRPSTAPGTQPGKDMRPAGAGGTWTGSARPPASATDGLNRRKVVARLPAAECPSGARCAMTIAPRAGIFSVRRGNGPRPTGRVMVRFRAAGPSPASTAVTSGGVVSSSAQVARASSPPAANPACAWSSSDSHRARADDSGCYGE